MAIRAGKCTNFGNCGVADSGQIIQVPDGGDAICPECRRALTLTALKQRSSTPYLLFAVVVGLLLGGIAYFAYKTLGPHAPLVAHREVAEQTALRLCGSNTIGAQLAPTLVTAFLKQKGFNDVKVNKTGEDEVKVSAVEAGSATPDTVTVQAHGSATAFTGLAKGSCDIGMASRKIKDAEVRTLATLGDMTSPANEHVLGLDGIAVIVNRANPLASLTIKQIAGLFSGETHSWSGVGGQDAAVKVYARDDKSGTYDTFKSLVLGSAALTPRAERFEDSRALSDAVANDPEGIGFVGLPYVGSAKALAVSEAGARELLPNRFTIATEDYLLSRRLYLYTAASPKPLAREFVDFSLSKAGQDVVAANGFVAQNVGVEQVEAPVEGASNQYRQATRGAERLSLDFRFRTGSIQLDNKALADIDRVTSLLSDFHYTGRNVLLLGFADSVGTPASNVLLSQGRAKSVASQFAQRGVEPGLITGFGSDMPVASNTSEDGRQKNRRVEIWIKK